VIFKDNLLRFDNNEPMYQFKIIKYLNVNFMLNLLKDHLLNYLSLKSYIFCKKNFEKNGIIIDFFPSFNY